VDISGEQNSLDIFVVRDVKDTSGAIKNEDQK